MKFREYLQLALPLTISTINYPLLTAVDSTVVGRLEDSVYLGGVAVGAVIFSTIYWLFGFLRIHTSAVVELFWIHQELHLFSPVLKEIHSFRKSAVAKFFIANTDLMIRTICLLTVTNMFVSKGSDFGKDVLAAISLLFQIQYIISYFFDGFGNTSSILAGESKEVIDSKIMNFGSLF
ncbi:MATE family efflux transporter [Fusobacterium necrophorum]|uniref:hypothetical protein n=1 Tax=Fusobacterium necrophorum TaxID=859 RepID=UPI0021C30D1A|nr:hypothetical protein [Fusobacterium necrophorum]